MLAGKVLGWVLGPTGKLAMALIAFVGWTMYQRADATMGCQEDQLREELAETKRQAELASVIAEEARQRADKSQNETELLRETNDELRRNLDTRPDLGCAIPDDVRDQLLRIR